MVSLDGVSRRHFVFLCFAMLDREEYVEQAHFFKTLAERSAMGTSTQDLLGMVREEVLSTTKLPHAIDFLTGELRLNGVFHTAMAKLSHYFTPFQTFVVAEAENERGKFDLNLALLVLAREADYRARGASTQGIFIYEFETLARNRLGYDKGLNAIAGDPVFNEAWRQWIQVVRRQVGLVDFADLIYVRSAHYQRRRPAGDHEPGADQFPALFGEGEGRIALANRGKDPLLLFGALHRHLGYPEVPRPALADESSQVIPQLVRRIEKLESRLKLAEEELKGGIDLSQYYVDPARPNRLRMSE
jgi:hypothetical protein